MQKPAWDGSQYNTPSMDPVFGSRTQVVLTHLLLHEFAGGWTSTSEDSIAECFARMSPAAAMMDKGYGNLIQKKSELHKEKTVEVRNVVKCVVLSETKK